MSDTTPVQRSVALVLGDCDFGTTFVELLRTIHRMYVQRGVLTRGQALLATKSARLHYRLYQETEGTPPPRDGYLENVSVLFDQDAERDYYANDHAHGAWILLLDPLEIHTY